MVLLETTVHQIPTCVVAMVINRTEKILEPSSNQWMKFFIGLDMAHGSKVSNISLNLESLNILTFQALKATRGLLHSFVLGWFYSASYFLAKIFKMFGTSLAHEQHRTSHRLDLPHDVGDAGFHMTVPLPSVEQVTWFRVNPSGDYVDLELLMRYQMEISSHQSGIQNWCSDEKSGQTHPSAPSMTVVIKTEIWIKMAEEKLDG